MTRTLYFLLLYLPLCWCLLLPSAGDDEGAIAAGNGLVNNGWLFIFLFEYLFFVIRFLNFFNCLIWLFNNFLF